MQFFSKKSIMKFVAKTSKRENYRKSDHSLRSPLASFPSGTTVFDFFSILIIFETNLITFYILIMVLCFISFCNFFRITYINIIPRIPLRGTAHSYRMLMKYNFFL